MLLMPQTAGTISVNLSTHHFTDSSLREKVLEHLFVGDLLKLLWINNRRDIEVLRADVDRGGYDLVLECNRVVRHVQLKSSRRGAKTASVDIQTRLADKSCGCVIWIFFDEETLDLGPFLWFGSEPGQCLPSLGDKVARHKKANSKGEKSYKPGLREVRRSRFVPVLTMDELVERLFGPVVHETACA